MLGLPSNDNCAELFGIQEAESFRIGDAHRDAGKLFIVHADEKLTAFFELEAAIRASNGHDRAAVPV